MPYTFAHIGYILPIKKKWVNYFSITGLVFGSLAPDYDILFRLTKVRFHIFQYDLKCIFFLIYPMAFLSAFFFHFFCRNIIIDNLPITLNEKYRKYKSVNFVAVFKNDFIRISYSIFLAIFLHLFLDSLCHILNAYYVRVFFQVVFKNELISNIAYYAAIYALPVLFSIAGFFLIYKYEYNKKLILLISPITKSQLLFYISVFICTILFLILKMSITVVDYEFQLDYIAISITSSLILAIYLTCFIYWVFSKNQQNA